MSLTGRQPQGFFAILRDAVRIHLRSDVAVGTCLSGGIDSSTLTVLINNLIRDEAPASVGDRQKTFSAVFSDTRFDESRYIDEIAAATGVDAHRVEPTPQHLWDDIDRLGLHAGRALRLALDLCPVLRDAPRKGERKSSAGRPGSR